MSKTYDQFLSLITTEKKGISLNDLAKKLTAHRNTITAHKDRALQENLIFEVGQTSGKKLFSLVQTIIVVSQGKILGYLSYDHEHSYFVYADPNETNKPYGGIDNTISVNKHENGLFPVFESILPEGIDRESLDNREHIHISEHLLYVDNALGSFKFFNSYLDALQYTKIKQKPAISWEKNKQAILKDNDFPNILDEKMLSIKKSVIFPKNLNDITRTLGLSGVQHKFSIDFVDKKIISASDSEYFMKPYLLNRSTYNYRVKKMDQDNNYLPYLSINEHLFMSFAKNELGFDVPYTAIIKDDIDYHFIIKRYDRHEGYKFEQYQFGQVANLNSEHKYDPTSEGLFDLLRNIIDEEQFKELMRFYVYSFVLMHSDLHALNMSIIKDETKVLFAPLYDVSSIGMYDLSGNELGLKLNGKLKNIRNSDFQAFFERYDLGDYYPVVRDNIVSTFKNQFPNYIDKLGDLKKLPIYTSRYSMDTLKKKLTKYYEFRISKLEKNNYFS
jgi:serine/threonine-protein kinase HipA